MASRKKQSEPQTPVPLGGDDLPTKSPYEQAVMQRFAEYDKMLGEHADDELIPDLTERERRFSLAYVQVTADAGRDTGMATVAYRRAFPMSDTSKHSLFTLAAALLKSERVVRYVAILRHQMSTMALLPARRMVRETEVVALSNILDFIRVLPDGEVRFDLTDVTPEQAACIASVEIEETFKPPGRKLKIKLHDKLRALDMAHRINGSYNDKMSLTLNIGQLDQAIIETKQKLLAMGVPQAEIDKLLTDVEYTEVKE